MPNATNMMAGWRLCFIQNESVNARGHGKCSPLWTREGVVGEQRRRNMSPVIACAATMVGMAGYVIVDPLLLQWQKL